MAFSTSVIEALGIAEGIHPRVVRFGMMKGLNFNINIRSQKQLWMGLYERELHGWFDRFSKGARTVIDGGGGYGYYSSYFLVKTEVEKVFCFEPNSEQREEMRRTFVLNNVHRDDRMSLFSKYITKDNSDTHATLDSLMDRIQWGCPNDG